MPATFSLELHFPLPAGLAPDRVIRALHQHIPLITPNPYLQRYARRDEYHVPADPFFAAADGNTVSYDIHDRIPIIPALGLSKDVTFPAVFQSFPSGVRVRADAAAGVTVRSVYEVVCASGGGEWELVERSRVECGALLRPFVARSFEAGHRDLCRKVLEDIQKATDKDLPPLPQEG